MIFFTKNPNLEKKNKEKKLFWGMGGGDGVRVSDFFY